LHWTAGSEEGDEPLEQLFDYDQYFPTSLPIRRHHPLDVDADTTADAAPTRQGVPQDLMLQEVWCCCDVQLAGMEFALLSGTMSVVSGSA